MRKILTREEAVKAYPEKTWNLADIYASDELWQEDLENLKQNAAKSIAFKGQLSNPEKLFEYMELQNKIAVEVSNLLNYAQRKSDEDTSVAKYQNMCGAAIAALTQISAEMSFETPEIISISDDDFENMFKEFPKLEKFRRYLTKTRALKDHVLSENEERIMSLAGEMAESPDSIYNMFSNADLTFEPAVDSNGEKYQLTSGTYISLVQSPDRELRRSAFKNLYARYGEFANTTSAILNSQVKSLIFSARARKFNSTLEVSLAGNEVPVEVYKNLIETVHQNMQPMYDYVTLRKKLLGLDELHMYDLYVPIVSDMDEKIPYEQAVETVLKALEPLGDEYISILKEGFTNRWIDVYENKGKCSGGYSAGAFCHPYVLLNYDDNIESMFTVCHEMGHSLHSYFSNKTQQPIDADYVIFVAEVASTCNEALLMQYLLKNTTDKRKKAYLINYFLEQFRTTLYRQTMFAEFELKINEYCEAGNTLTPEWCNKVYHDLNKLYFGDDIIIDKEIDLEWSRIPHFYYDFYVYQYATGYSAAIALSQRILDDDPQHTKDYLQFLHEGCLYDPITLLRHAGVDMASPEPVANALETFGNLVKEFGELLK